MTLARGEVSVSASAKNEASEARLWSNAHNIKKLAKNIATPVTLWVIDA